MKKIFDSKLIVFVCIFSFISVGIVLNSCKKKNKYYYFNGKVLNMVNNEAEKDVKIFVEASKISSGTFDLTMNKIAETQTDDAGNYSLKIPVARYVKLKLSTSKSEYYRTSAEFESLSGGADIKSDFYIGQKSTIIIRLRKIEPKKKANAISASLENVNSKCQECVKDVKRELNSTNFNKNQEILLYAVAGEKVNLTVTVSYDNVSPYTISFSFVCEPGESIKDVLF